MCGRFTLSSPQKIKTRFHAVNDLPLLHPSWNIAPAQPVPTILRLSPNQILLMKWGFLFNHNSSRSLINIRSESTRDKPYFRRLLLSKRCLVVADSFYEWGEVTLENKPEKYPFNFFLPGRLLFGFAALYNDFPDASGKPYYTCAILTCPANSMVKKVHSRMPVIIPRSAESFWLNPTHTDFDSFYALLKPYPSSKMKMHLVSRRVNNPRLSHPSLVEKFSNPTSYPKL